MVELGNPSTVKFLSPLGFKFKIPRLPNFEYFVQGFNFPSLSLDATGGVKTPFGTLVLPGDHVTFDLFTVTFKIDENMSDYFEIYDWIVGLGRPDSFDQYAALESAEGSGGKGVMSDAHLIILNGTMNPNIEIAFNDIIPQSLSGFNLITTDEDVSYLTATATFKFREYTYKRL